MDSKEKIKDYIKSLDNEFGKAQLWGETLVTKNRRESYNYR